MDEKNNEETDDAYEEESEDDENEDEEDTISDFEDANGYDKLYYETLNDSRASSPSTKVDRYGLRNNKYQWYTDERGISMRGPLLKGKSISESEHYPLYGQDTVKLKVERHHKYEKCLVVFVLTYKPKYNRKYKFYGHKHRLQDFLRKWETDFGVDWEKSGWTYDETVRALTDVVKDNSQKINITMDTKLINLLNKDIEWHSFKPGLENNKVIVLDNFTEYKQDSKNWVNRPYEYYATSEIVDLNDLCSDNKNVNKLKWCLIKRGWCLVKFPQKYQNDILNASKQVVKELNEYYKYMNLKDNIGNDGDLLNKWKCICDAFGFTNFQDYKSVFRIFTKEMVELFGNIYPKNILNAVKVICNVMDNISIDIIKNTYDLWKIKMNECKNDEKEAEVMVSDDVNGMKCFCGKIFEEKVFGECEDINIEIHSEYEWLESYNKKKYLLCACFQDYDKKVSETQMVYRPVCDCWNDEIQDKELIILKCGGCVKDIQDAIAFEKTDLCLKNDDIKFGMIDFVMYKNKMEVKDKKYKMLQNNKLNVDSHIDPGLFSIGFYQNESGLQLVDKNDDKNYNPWIQIPTYTNGVYGVLWTGQYGKDRNKDCQTGIHRVVYNHDKPRCTAWYEVCINKQIAEQVFKEAKKRKRNVSCDNL